MVLTNLSKDIEVEVMFTSHPNNDGSLVDSQSYTTYFIFDETDIWEVKLWQESDEQILPIGIPTKFFVEFEFPQSLSNKLTPGKAFEVWNDEVVGKGFILEILNLEERAQENIEYIVQRPTDEVFRIRDYIKSLFGEPVFNDRDRIFYQKLKVALAMEDFKDYLWLWDKPCRHHTLVEFDNPKHIPKLAQLLPDNPIPIWFLVDIDRLLSTWFLYSATFTTLEQLLQKYKFSRYYIVAEDFSWLIRKINKSFIAVGNDVEHRLKQSQSM